MNDRQKKSPRERAEDALGPAERGEQKTAKKVQEAEATLAQAREAHAAAVRRLEYVGANPDLAEEDRERVAKRVADLRAGRDLDHAEDLEPVEPVSLPSENDPASPPPYNPADFGEAANPA